MTDVTMRPGQVAVGRLDSDARAVFITKTYSHLFLGVMAFIVSAGLMLRMGVGESLIEWFGGSTMKMLLFFGGFVVAGWLGTHWAATARTKPMQYTGFFIYVLLQALFFCPLLYIAATHYDGVITKAAIATVGGFCCLTGIAFWTRKDFSFLGGLVKWGFICALLLIVGSLVFGFELGLFFSIVMVALAGAAILYDTSNVIHHYPEDRYVAAGLALFASVAVMFFYLIRIFMELQE